MTATVTCILVLCPKCRQIHHYTDFRSGTITCPGCGETYQRVRDEWVDAKSLVPRTRKSALYGWTWIGGGFNHCFARSKAEAMRNATQLGAPLSIKPDPSSFKRYVTREEQDKYFRDTWTD